jgi:hypothetical protein
MSSYIYPSYDSFMDDFFLPLLFTEEEHTAIVVNFNELYQQISQLFQSCADKPTILLPDGYYELSSSLADTTAAIKQLLLDELADHLKDREQDVQIAIECWLLDWFTEEIEVTE